MVIKNFLNLKGHQNRITGSKVTVILAKGYILPIGEVASGRVCAGSLRSRLVLHKHTSKITFDLCFLEISQNIMQNTTQKRIHNKKPIVKSKKFAPSQKVSQAVCDVGDI